MSMWIRCCAGSMATPSKERGSATKVGGYPVLLRGLSPLVATLSTPIAAPVIAATRLRGGRAGSARGAASLVAEALGAAVSIGAGSHPHATVLLRGDSAFYTGTVVSRGPPQGCPVLDHRAER